MKFALINLAVLCWLPASLVLAQDPASKPCLDNPIQWERRSGPPSSPNAIVVVPEDMRILGPISVAEMIAQLPRGTAGPQCGRSLALEVGNLSWLVSECRGTDQLTILRFEPAPGNAGNFSFTLSLMGGMCNVAPSSSLGEEVQRAEEAFQQLTLQEIDRLVADVRANEDQ